MNDHPGGCFKCDTKECKTIIFLMYTQNKHVTCFTRDVLKVFKFAYLSKFSYKSVESYKLLRLQPGQRVKIQQQQKRQITYRQTGESISGVSD